MKLLGLLKNGMPKLFDCIIDYICSHLKNIFKDLGLSEISVTKKLLITVLYGNKIFKAIKRARIMGN